MHNWHLIRDSFWHYPSVHTVHLIIILSWRESGPWGSLLIVIRGQGIHSPFAISMTMSPLDYGRIFWFILVLDYMFWGLRCRLEILWGQRWSLNIDKMRHREELIGTLSAYLVCWMNERMKWANEQKWTFFKRTFLFPSSTCVTKILPSFQKLTLARS
jgi:hypothetical protein